MNFIKGFGFRCLKYNILVLYLKGQERNKRKQNWGNSTLRNGQHFKMRVKKELTAEQNTGPRNARGIIFILHIQRTWKILSIVHVNGHFLKYSTFQFSHHCFSWSKRLSLPSCCVQESNWGWECGLLFHLPWVVWGSVILAVAVFWSRDISCSVQHKRPIGTLRVQNLSLLMKSFY